MAGWWAGPPEKLFGRGEEQKNPASISVREA